MALSCSNDPYAWGDCDSIASNGCEQPLVNNDAHCGACNNPCGSLELCEGKTCVCSAPLSLCGSTCVDTSDDLANCGGCGQVCGGGVCVQGNCEPRVLANADMPSSLALTDVDVYWTSNVSQGRVARVSKSGGASSTFANSENYPDLIVIQGGDALWARDETRLLIKPLVSGSTSTLASNENWIRGLVADSDVAYWTAGSSVHVVELAGSAVDSFYPGLNNAHGIALDGPFLHVGSDGYVWRIMPPSNDIELVAYGFQDVSDIEVSGSTVYWVSSNENCDQVFSAPKTGGDRTDATMLLDCTDGPATIAVDGVHVYVALESEGVVQRISVQGGSAETLASDQVNPTAIVVDDNAVYWAILALAK